MVSLKMASFMGSLDRFTKTSNTKTEGVSEHFKECITTLLYYTIMGSKIENFAIVIKINNLVL